MSLDLIVLFTEIFDVALKAAVGAYVVKWVWNRV